MQKKIDDGSRRAAAFRDFLNEEEELKVSKLTEACNSFDGTSYGVPLDGDLYLLKESEDGRGDIDGLLVIWHLGATVNGRETDEVLAFTRPEKRRQGIFKSLFCQASGVLRSSLTFSVYDNEPALMTLRALGTEFRGSELMMEMKLDAGSALGPAEEELSLDEEAGALYADYGEAYFKDFGDRAYIYGVLVYERYRGLGYGKKLLRGLLRILRDQGYASCFLQVSSENIPAMRLYLGEGFETTEKLDLYQKNL